MRIIDKPSTGEYPPYAEMYMKLVPADGQILNYLRINFYEVKRMVDSLSDEKLLYRYRKGKWSVKQILVHLIDDERIYSYRALCFARNETEKLVGFNQDNYAFYSDADERTKESILEEYEAVRFSTITLFQNLPESSLCRIGGGTGSFYGASVRALAYHIAGHELHHLNFIKQHYL